MSSDAASVRGAAATALAGASGPFTVALVCGGVLVYGTAREVPTLVLALAASALLVALVVLARRGGHEQEADPASYDTVTGLAAREELVKELDRRLSAANPTPTLLLRFDLHGFKAYNDDFGHEAGNVLLRRLGRKLAAVAAPDGQTFRLTGDDLCILVPVGEGDGERLIEEATAALAEEGDGFRIGSSFGGVLLPYETSDSQAGLKLAEERLAANRRSKQRIRTVRALVEAVSARRGTAPVSGGLESLAVAIGGLLGVEGDDIEALARAAELHAVGKVSIPTEILEKPGPLDEREWAFVRQQTVVGERILQASPEFFGVASIVRATCENWDGTGHPDGLAGLDIPLAARIIRVCAAFDAMVSPRPYRAAMTPNDALAEVESRAGTSFDPAVVRVLSRLVRARGEATQAA